MKIELRKQKEKKIEILAKIAIDKGWCDDLEVIEHIAKTYSECIYTRDSEKYKDKTGRDDFLEVREETLIELVKIQLEEDEGKDLVINIDKFK